MKPPAEPFDVVRTPIATGATLIEASAGTGKTYSLTGLVLRLLLEGHVPHVGTILVMTFTKAATAELVNRIRGAVRDAIATFQGRATTRDDLLDELHRRHGAEGLHVLQRAQRDLDDLEVSTIHGFCRRLLEQHAFETGVPFDVEYGEDDGILLASAAEDFWRHTVYPAGDLVGAIVAARKWTPETFVPDYRAVRRHPGIEILPHATPLAEAIAALDAPVAHVREAWDPEIISAFLEPPRYLKNKAPSPAQQRGRVAAAEAFCRRGCMSAIAHVLSFGERGPEKHLRAADKKAYVASPFAKALEALDTAVATLEHSLRVTLVTGLEALVETAKRSAGVAHYDDLLYRLRDALRDPERAPALARAARERFRAVLVDEFQDTDAIQYEIFRDLFGDALLCFVGDPKQAIYGFRGADVFAYLEAKRDARREYTLGRNFRSETALVGAVNEVFAAGPTPFVLDDIPFLRAAPAGRADSEGLGGDDRRALEWMRFPPESNLVAAQKTVIEAVVTEIVRLIAPDSRARIGSRPVLPEDIAILVDTNASAVELQASLRRAQVAAVISQSGNVLESEEAVELQALLAAVIAPRSATAVRGALATRVFGFAAHEIVECADGGDAWDRLIERLHELHEVWARRGFVAMAEALLALTRARENLLRGHAGPRRLTNLLHLIELVEQATEEHHLSPEGTIEWLSRMRASPDVHAAEAAEIRLESDENAVQITTIHKSKGLEYAITFCPFLWRVREATKGAARLAHLDDGRVVYRYPMTDEDDDTDDEITTAHAREELSDRTRRAYVALTRAKHRCYVAWGVFGRSKSRGSALAHLLAHAGNAGAGIDALCTRHPEWMAVRDVESGAGAPRLETGIAKRPPLRARQFPESARSRLAPWRVASFSSFRATADAAPERPDYRDPHTAPPRVEAAPAGIFAFASGVRAGTCLHEVFEHCDFTRVRDDETAALVAATLRRHGLDAATAHAGRIDPAATVRTMLADVVDSELPGAGFTLATVEMRSRLTEWQFHLPMAPVSPQRLADVFAEHAAGDVRDRYTQRLRTLAGKDVEGYLMGFVDLVFVHEDRWYLVDWKSNHLGNEIADYDHDATSRAMRDHHYVLQYHLYALALHRYLGQRLPGYEYDRHFGGAYYAFLRGIRAGSPAGWHFDRPSRALLDALDDTMRGRNAR